MGIWRPNLEYPQFAASSPASRSLIANNPLKVRGTDGRTVAGRRYRDICIAITADLGGKDNLSEAARILIRQAAALSVQLENLQAKIVAGEDVDTEQLVRLTNLHNRQRCGTGGLGNVLTV